MINKILIHLPDKEDEIASLIPFLCTLEKEFPGSQKNILSTGDFSHYFSFLPFEINFYKIDKAVLKNPFTIHKYCYNLVPVFNVDLAFSLDQNWKSSFIAFCFRARHRIGIKSIKSKVFQTSSVDAEEGTALNRIADLMLSLFRKRKFESTEIFLPEFTIDDVNFGQIKIVTCLFDGRLWDIENFRESFQLLSELVDGVKFKLIIPNGDTKKFMELKPELNNKNYYEVLNSDLGLSSLLQKVSYSDLFLTLNPFYASLSAYLHVKSCYLAEKPVDWDHEMIAKIPLKSDSTFNLVEIEKVLNALDI